MAPLGEPWQGLAGRGGARHGLMNFSVVFILMSEYSDAIASMALHGTARRGMAWHGLARLGKG